MLRNLLLTGQSDVFCIMKLCLDSLYEADTLWWISCLLAVSHLASLPFPAALFCLVAVSSKMAAPIPAHRPSALHI